MVYLLDCTLRDGGYVNDWEFGYNNLISIFERLADSNVDWIEVGFLDERRPFDINRSIMPDTDSVDRIFGHLDKKNSQVIGMIDYGTCGLEHIRPCAETFLDGIRVIFKKHNRKPALEFCARLKELGYKVFAQLVSVTSYSDREMMDLIDQANEVKPYAVSMVDTYGLMHQNNLGHYFDLLDNNLDPEISIGYHGHNNFQMGYANCVSMIDRMFTTRRKLLVDGTLYGMGKSAGNAPIELIIMHLNSLFPGRYDVNQILEAIDSNIKLFYSPATWGYNLFFYIAASNNCHPNYVSFLLGKNTLSIKSVNEILGSLTKEKALLYDEKYIEGLYVEYQANKVNDTEALNRLESELKNREILLVGPGTTVNTAGEMIRRYIGETRPVVISINCILDGIDQDYIFLCNSKRYIQLASRLSEKEYRIIATSNLTKTGKNDFDFILNYESLLEKAPIVVDSAILMLLKILERIPCRSVALAGLDGYTHSKTADFMKEDGADKIEDIPRYINSYIGSFIRKKAEKTDIHFLTESLFSGIS